MSLLGVYSYMMVDAPVHYDNSLSGISIYDIAVIMVDTREIQ